MKQPYENFMGQFEAARKELESLPQFLKASLKVATLTYPTGKVAGAEVPPKVQVKKKS